MAAAQQKPVDMGSARDIVDERHASRPGLRPVQLFSLAFGVAVGVGWIVVLGGWLRDAGPVGASLAFTVAGLFVLAIGRAYADLAVEFPVRGGEFTYATRAFGDGAGYWVGWFLVLAYVSVIAFEMVSLAWIVRELLPGLLPPEASGPDFWGASLGIAAIGIVVATSAGGSRMSAAGQDLLVLIKVAMCAVLILLGLSGGSAANLEPLWGAHAGGPLAGALAVFATAPFFFAGFGAVAQAVAELRSESATRLMPIVMTAAIAGTASFYILIILSAAYAAPRDAVLASSLPAVTAFATAAGSPVGGRVVLALGLVGVLTIINGVFFACARLLAALAEADHLPRLLGTRSRRDAPFLAGLIVAFVACLLSLAGKAAISPFLNVASASIAAVMTATCAGLLTLRMRRKEPGRFTPVTGAVLAGTMAIVPLWEAAQAPGPSLEWAVILVWGAIGLLFWVHSKRPRREAAANSSSIA